MKRPSKNDVNPIDPRKNEDDCEGDGGCDDSDPGEKTPRVTIIVDDRQEGSESPPEPPNDRPRPDPYRGLRWATDDDGHAYMTDLPELSGKG